MPSRQCRQRRARGEKIERRHSERPQKCRGVAAARKDFGVAPIGGGGQSKKDPPGQDDDGNRDGSHEVRPGRAVPVAPVEEGRGHQQDSEGDGDQDEGANRVAPPLASRLRGPASDTDAVTSGCPAGVGTSNVLLVGRVRAPANSSSRTSARRVGSQNDPRAPGSRPSAAARRRSGTQPRWQRFRAVSRRRESVRRTPVEVRGLPRKGTRLSPPASFSSPSSAGRPAHAMASARRRRPSPRRRHRRRRQRSAGCRKQLSRGRDSSVSAA